MTRPDGPWNAAPIASPGAPSVDALRARAATAVTQQKAREAAANANAPDPGRVLASYARPDGTELRVSMHTYEGKPFVRVAPWQRSGEAWWPIKGKGVTVKVRELATVAAALLDAIDAANTDGANAPREGR